MSKKPPIFPPIGEGKSFEDIMKDILRVNVKSLTCRKDVKREDP